MALRAETTRWAANAALGNLSTNIDSTSLPRRAAGIEFARKVRATYTPGLASMRLEKRLLPKDLARAGASAPVATALAASSECLEESQHLPQASSTAASEGGSVGPLK
jgi:hypothetical protein